MNPDRIVRAILLLTTLSLPFLAAPGETAAFRERGRGGMPLPAVGVGARIGYDFDVDSWSLGGQLWLPIARGAVKFVPSGDIFFVDGGRYWQINADVALSGRGSTYYGGGLALTNMRFGENGARNTKVGYNLFVGQVIPLARWPLRPFLEGRWTFVEGENPFRLLVGFTLSPGGRPGR